MASDPRFEQIITLFQSELKTIGQGTRTEDKQRDWMDFRGMMSIGKFEYEKIHDLFNRDGANEDYLQKRTDEDAQAKDLQTAKITGDFMAACERDYRMRHRSRIRMFVHASSKETTNSTDIGPLRRNTVDWMTAIMKEQETKAE